MNTTEKQDDVQAIAERLIEREVYCCDSSLVDMLIRNNGESHTGNGFGGFDYEDIENIYADVDGLENALECKEFIDDIGGDYGNAENPADYGPWDYLPKLKNLGLTIPDNMKLKDARRLYLEKINRDGDIDGLDDWLEAARECAQDNPREPLEWWRVSKWLVEKLRDIGEVVIDNDYGEWWGRTTSGQAIIQDGVFQRIAESLG